MYDVTRSGILTTGSDLVFAGGTEGYFQALDARSGTLLWKVNLGGDTYVAIAAGNGLFVFGLRD